MANLSACHRDPMFWAKPDQFYPEHFLKDGVLVEDKPGFLPYGVGKRMCPGATLADMQVETRDSIKIDFLFISGTCPEWEGGDRCQLFQNCLKGFVG